jgi:multidrug efflux pump subunit AcrA (membrane-fusion protein)
MEINHTDTVPAKTIKSSHPINLRSEMVQEIISHQPDFIEKWALMIFLFILFLLLVSTWFIKYPDIIEARAMLTAANAPKEIIPRQEGRLERLFFHNNDDVKKGDIIGWLESTASQRDVINLSIKLDSCLGLLTKENTTQLSAIFKSRYTNLGEIQQAYQQFSNAWQLYNDYTVNGFYAQKKKALESDVLNVDKTNQTLQKQKKIISQDISLAGESYKMNKTLADAKVETQEELRVQKSKFLNKQSALPQLEASVLANESQKRDKQNQLEQLNHDFSQQKIIFQQALMSLKSLVDDWKKKFLLESPVNGKLAFTIPLQENQYLRAGKIIGYINPDDSYFYAETNLSQTNFGKITTGLKVQLRFDAYPYQEVGYVAGTLSYVSKVPSDSGFLATIHLDHELITNSNHSIPYKNGLRAHALIITKNMRLIDRLYYSIVKSTSVGNK